MSRKHMLQLGTGSYDREEFLMSSKVILILELYIYILIYVYMVMVYFKQIKLYIYRYEYLFNNPLTHFWVPTPLIILTSGICFEDKHKVLKILANVIPCQINLGYTISYKLQL